MLSICQCGMVILQGDEIDHRLPVFTMALIRLSRMISVMTSYWCEQLIHVYL